MTDSLTEILAKNAQTNKLTPAAPTPPTETETETAPPEERKYQHYTSARPAVKLITEKGKKISFTNFEFLTRDEDIIEYIDRQIDEGLKGITKGKLMTKSERDPMEILRKQAVEEYKAGLVQEATDKAAGIKRDMGTTKNPGDAAINPASTDAVAK